MILTAGCSWTDQYHNIFPMWPSLVSVNKRLKNIGQAGINNNKIAQTILYQKNIKKYDKVLILWTHWLREYCFVENKPSTKEWRILRTKTEIDIAKYFANEKYKDEVIRDNVAANMFAIHAVQTYLEENDVDYFMVQGLSPYHDSSNLDLYLHTISELEHLINKDKFYKWPPLKEIGGFNCEEDLHLLTDDSLYLHFDFHPNEKGHELIANVFLSNTNI